MHGAQVSGSDIETSFPRKLCLGTMPSLRMDIYWQGVHLEIVESQGES